MGEEEAEPGAAAPPPRWPPLKLCVSLLQDFVINHAAGTFYWVGLTDQRGRWEWVNETPYTIDRR